jgi:predicted molibdopterin-dependent oxidoreductase YjgC
MVSGLTALKSADFWRATHQPAVEMSPEDAAVLGLTGGQAAIVRSEHGELRLPVKVTDKCPSGLVFVPRGLANAPVGALLGGKDAVTVSVTT